jgi:hypothetical protein
VFSPAYELVEVIATSPTGYKVRRGEDEVTLHLDDFVQPLWLQRRDCIRIGMETKTVDEIAEGPTGIRVFFEPTDTQQWMQLDRPYMSLSTLSRRGRL